MVQGIVDGMRLVELLPIAVNQPIAEMNSVAGKSNHSLHQMQSRLRGFEEHHNVAVADIAIGKQTSGIAGLGGGRAPVDKDVVSHQEPFPTGDGKNAE